MQQSLTPESASIVLQADHALACRYTTKLDRKLEMIANIEVYDLFTGTVVNTVDHPITSNGLRVYGSSRFVVVLEPTVDAEEPGYGGGYARSSSSNLTIYDTSEEEPTISTATLLFPIATVEFSEDNQIISFGFRNNLHVLLIINTSICIIQSPGDIALGNKWVFYRQSYPPVSVALNTSNGNRKVFTENYSVVFGDDRVSWINPATETVVLLNLDDDVAKEVATLDHGYQLTGISAGKDGRLSIWARENRSNTIYFLDADSQSLVKVLRSTASQLRAVDQTVLFFDETAAYSLIRLQHRDKFKPLQTMRDVVSIPRINFHLYNPEEGDLVAYNSELTERYIYSRREQLIFMQQAGNGPAPSIHRLDLASMPLNSFRVSAFLPLSNSKFLIATSSISEETSEDGGQLYMNRLNYVSVRERKIVEYSLLDPRQVTQLRSYGNEKVIVATLTPDGSTQRHSLFFSDESSKLRCIKLVEGSVLDANTSIAVLSTPVEQIGGDDRERPQQFSLAILKLKDKAVRPVRNPLLHFVALDASSIYFASARGLIFRRNISTGNIDDASFSPIFHRPPLVSTVLSEGRHLLSLSKSFNLTVTSTETGKLLHATPSLAKDMYNHIGMVQDIGYPWLEQAHSDAIRLSSDGRRLLVSLPGQDRLVIINDNSLEHLLNPPKQPATITRQPSSRAELMDSKARDVTMAKKQPVYFNKSGQSIIFDLTFDL